MSVKKPEPLNPTPGKRLCPVCGKPSYSLSGMHPQCSQAQENTALKAAQKAALAEAATEVADVDTTPDVPKKEGKSVD